jgi:hypothetical protein
MMEIIYDLMLILFVFLASSFVGGAVAYWMIYREEG